MLFCGFVPGAREWRAYWRHILLLGGALFLTAGVIFFIAWNWADMHRFARMALVGAIVAGTGLGAVWRGPDTLPGRVLLLCSGISVGPLLAVFGQTYQTGAELWELFRVWTVVLAALAVVGRQAALWFATWISANVFVMLWLGRSMGSPLEALGMFSLLPECVLGLALAAAVWEWFAWREKTRGGARHSWLQSRWLPRLLFFDLTVRLTAYLCMIIFDQYWMSSLTEFILPYAVLPYTAVAVATVSWYWHRKRMPDLFMFACLISACAVLLVAFLIRIEFLFGAEVGAVFLWGLLLVGITASIAAILLSLQRRMEAEAARHARHDGAGDTALTRRGVSGADFFAIRPAPAWNALQGHLRTRGLIGEDAPLPPPPAPAVQAVPPSPWYVRMILAVGGWIAAVVFLLFLVLFLYDTMRIRSYDGIALFVASWFPLGIAFGCLRARGNFVRHFGFSLALAGSIAVCIGLGMMTRFTADLYFGMTFGVLSLELFLFALTLAFLCLFMDSAAYRFLAALCIVGLVATGIVSSGFSGVNLWGWPDDVAMVRHRVAVYATILWWSAVAVALAATRLREKDWRARAWGGMVPPLFFGAYGGMMAYLMCTFSQSFYSIRAIGNIWHMLAGSFTVGVGAAAGLVYLAWKLTDGKTVPAERAAIRICAALALPLGFFLPGVALAAFGLTLARHIGSLVMQGTTGAFLFAYVIYYYYFLGVPLVYKSLLLSATGVVLLALASALGRLYRNTKEARHA